MEMQVTVNGVALTKDNWREVLKPTKLSREEKIDTGGKVKELRDFYKGVYEFLKEIIAAEYDEDEWEDAGTEFEAIRTMKSRVITDNDKIKTEMGEEWFKAHCKTVEYPELRIRRKKT